MDPDLQRVTVRAVRISGLAVGDSLLNLSDERVHISLLIIRPQQTSGWARIFSIYRNGCVWHQGHVEMLETVTQR